MFDSPIRVLRSPDHRDGDGGSVHDGELIDEHGVPARRADDGGARRSAAGGRRGALWINGRVYSFGDNEPQKRRVNWRLLLAIPIALILIGVGIAAVTIFLPLGLALLAVALAASAFTHHRRRLPPNTDPRQLPPIPLKWILLDAINVLIARTLGLPVWAVGIVVLFTFAGIIALVIYAMWGG